ncbi:MAG: 16S rRNA (guanine(527)-N(7))-methyltransferase RsmG [Clostridia bacterium]|nr:16S rRNA (guanine(527)-N(7))-methyltransferase RsmG [Clostridia bacterium]
MTYEQFSTLYNAQAACLPESCRCEDAMMRLYTICEKLVENNRKYNLTAITDPEGVVEKHIVDSLLPLALLADKGILTPELRLPEGKMLRLIDVGAGAGFPSLPFAAVMPGETTRILAVDATAKKVRHITETAQAAGIGHIAAEAGRAEELATGRLRESFSIATARAVAELRILVELTAPFAAVGGWVIALKGSRAAEEIPAAEKIAKVLGLGAPEVVEYTLPSGDGRALVIYKKERKTPEGYPRAYAKIKAGV